MTMTQTTSFTGTADERLVTVADLRYELERERQITLAHFARIDQRFLDLTTSVDARFEQVNERFHELATSIDARFEQVDQRFERVDKRFDRLETQVDARFDALDERLRSNKTLVILSISTAASIASVVISLLK